MLGENNHMSFRNMAETSSGDPYKDLGWAIVGQAIQDYYTYWTLEYKYGDTKRKLDKNGVKMSTVMRSRRKKVREGIHECEEFFTSEYFKLLTENKIPKKKIALLMDILKEKAKSREPFHRYRTELMNWYFGDGEIFSYNVNNNGKTFYH